jgi:hypothetical protein
MSYHVYELSIKWCKIFSLAPPINPIWLPKLGFSAEKSRKILDFSPKCYKASDSNAVFGSFDW